MGAGDRTAARLVAALCSTPTATLVRSGDGYVLTGAAERRRSRVSAAAVSALLARGLLEQSETGDLKASDAAFAWMKRGGGDALAFRRQHGTIASGRLEGRDVGDALLNLDESPIGALARRATSGGAPWLAPHTVIAAERLRRDFEVGQLQPRITANWSASVASGRRADGGGMADLTEAALSARRRFDRAIRAVGPELSGVIIDICCLLKGLEAVERERLWPARSAKLVLRLALESLSRHYGYTHAASGRESANETRHWGAEDYRPRIS